MTDLELQLMNDLVNARRQLNYYKEKYLTSSELRKVIQKKDKVDIIINNVDFDTIIKIFELVKL